MLADYHVHTSYSLDSKYPMEEVIKDAIAKGIDEICFTDHVDLGIYYDGKETTISSYDDYFKNIREYALKYPNITIKTGLEFGMQTNTIQRYEELFKSYPFDFIIMSVHEIGDMELWTYDYQEGKTQIEYNLGYYNEILNIIKNYHNYSVLGHLDSIVRYDKAGPCPFEIVKPVIIEILKTIIKDGKGLEVNTSNIRYRIKEGTPSLEILKLYHELGGEIITLGSDSHMKEHLGFNIENMQKVLKDLGFKYFMTYEKMEMIKHEL